MNYSKEPVIILMGFEKGNSETFSHIENCIQVFADHWAKKPERLHKTKGKIVIHPNAQHFRVWGTEKEVFIEFIG